MENSWEKRPQLSDVLSEFVIFLKLGVLWWKLKIFIANFSHLSPNQFWRIFSMLLNSHPTIYYFDAKQQFDWTVRQATRPDLSAFWSKQSLLTQHSLSFRQEAAIYSLKYWKSLARDTSHEIT